MRPAGAPPQARDDGGRDAAFAGARAGGVVPAPVVLACALLDAAHVGLFALAGRRAHAEALTLGGWFETARPFLVGLMVGYAVLHLVRKGHSPASLVSGVLLWLWTLLLGLAVRVLGGDSAALPFVAVATLVLLLLLLGWRCVWLVVRRVRAGGRPR